MMTARLAALLVVVMLALGCSTEVGGGTGGDGSNPDDDSSGDQSDDGTSDDDGSSGDDDSGSGGDDSEECPGVNVALTDVIPSVLLLVDRSGTMTFDFGNTDRWSAVFDTLMNNDTGLVRRLDQEIRFGISLYTSDDGFAGGPCPFLAQVEPKLGNYGPILDLYSGLQPIEDTPTAPSLAAAQASLAAVQEPGPKIIVLATDGEPDTCNVPDPDGLPAARAESVAATQAAHTAGIDVYVISVGDQVSQQHLQDLANAGVGLPIGGAENAPFYQALDPGALVAAFDTIIGGVRSCTFALDGVIDLDQAETGTVTLDGATLDFGTDWQLRDESTLEILGDACATILAGGDHEVTAEFECGSVVD
jgi:hypothetical protein